MTSLGFAYVEADTPVHRLDARAKILLLLVCSVGVLLVRSGAGLAVAVAMVVALAVVARIPFGVMNRMLVPVYVLAAFSLLFNVLAQPDADGMLKGLFFAVRMVVLVAASFVVCLTTSPEELLDGFTRLIAPLKVVKAPVDDIALTLALSIRFIPLVEREFTRIRMAQKARGAESAGSIGRRLGVLGSAFADLFVGLFRHADALALAMDARCYGASERRTRLPRSS